MSVTMQNRSQCLSSLPYQSLQAKLHALHLWWVLYVHMCKQMYFGCLFALLPTSTCPLAQQLTRAAD